MDGLTYQCSDMNLCALLIFKGQKVVTLKKEGSRIVFHFMDPTLCEHLAGKYFGGTLLVEPLTFATAIRQVKDMTYAELRRPGGKP